jgi:hypothetical protein
MSKPRIGPAIYLALDGVSNYAAMITMVDEKTDTVSITTFPPGAGPTFLNRIRFDDIGRKPGTCFYALG